MISSIVRVGLAAIALGLIVGPTVAEGQQIAAETQVARVPSWMWHTYKAYLKKPHYRALACATAGRAGFCASGHSMPTAGYAAERVLEYCDAQVSRQYREFGSCRLYFIGNIDVSGLKASELEAAIRVYQQNPNATTKDLETPTELPPSG